MIEISFPFDCSVLPKTYKIKTQVSQRLNVFSFSLPFCLIFYVENAKVEVLKNNNKYFYVVKFSQMSFARDFTEKPLLYVKEDFSERNLVKVEKILHEKMLELNKDIDQRKKRVTNDGWKKYK